jgi:hypothetical protein
MYDFTTIKILDPNIGNQFKENLISKYIIICFIYYSIFEKVLCVGTILQCEYIEYCHGYLDHPYSLIITLYSRGFTGTIFRYNRLSNMSSSDTEVHGTWLWQWEYSYRWEY